MSHFDLHHGLLAVRTTSEPVRTAQQHSPGFMSHPTFQMRVQGNRQRHAPGGCILILMTAKATTPLERTQSGIAGRVSRRSLLLAMGQILSTSGIAATTDVPASLDHIILGCNDLDRVVQFVEEQTGVRAAYGGVHPGRGTRNALLSLGGRRYLELMAPDPAQKKLEAFPSLPTLHEPRLLGWVVHTDNIDVIAERLRRAGIAFHGPADGARKRPDGRELKWRKLDLNDDRHGVLPSFIQWNSGSIHPSSDSPAGCRVTGFAVGGNAVELRHMFELLGLDQQVENSANPQFHVDLAGPKGTCELSS